MKIVIATDYYIPTLGGIETVVHNLAIWFSKKGHKVSIIAPSTSWKYYEEKEGDVTVYRVSSVMVQKAKKLRYSLQVLHKKKVRKIITSIHPDIIHIESPEFIAHSAYAIARELHIPIIGTSHLMPENLLGGLPVTKQIGDIISKVYLQRIIHFYNKLDYLTAPTPTAIELLKIHGLTTPSVAISNGIDLKKFDHITSTQKQLLKQQLQLPDKPIILYVGRFDKEKCVDTLITALHDIMKADFHVVLAGMGIQENALKQLAKKLSVIDKITFTGYLSQENLLALYATSAIFVMPSIAELQSLVTMDAMASGLPIIGANAVALPHLIKHNENGFLFKPQDAKDLAKYLFTMLSDTALRESMGKKSKEIIKEHSIEHIISVYEELYKKVIENSKKQ